MFKGRKKAIKEINRMIFEEHNDSQFEENQNMRAYSAGIIDGLGMALAALTKKPSKEAPYFPLSISFYEEDDTHIYAERTRERIFDLQYQPEVDFFLEEAGLS